MKIKQVAKDIKVVNLKKFVEIYEKEKLHVVEKSPSARARYVTKGIQFDKYA